MTPLPPIAPSRAEDASGRPTNKAERLAAANKLVYVIASLGRRFFYHDGRTGALSITHGTNRLVWIDHHSKREVHILRGGRMRGFTGGGTLQSLVENLADFVRTGKPVRADTFGPWPEWLCEGDLWGYGSDMAAVREAAAVLGVSAPSPARAAPPHGQEVTGE